MADQFHFTLGGTQIPSVSEKPIKSLGKMFDQSLKDTASRQQIRSDLTAWLTAIDKSGLPGKFKDWMYEHAILPRLLCPLLVHEVPVTTVEALERNNVTFLHEISFTLTVK